jgi:hypothetical protein
MSDKRTGGPNHVRLSGTEYKKIDLRSMENLPLEVNTLLDVLSRIEIRRQAKLHALRKEVS